MTMALCFNCGETKFGALCPCPKCSVNSTGNINLDIVFSDHNYAVETLGEFGEVVKAIHRVCDDSELCFDAFIYFVSLNHSDILGITLDPVQESRCIDVLEKAKPPKVTVKPSWSANLKAEMERKHRDGQTTS